jgi:hypothetical protein
MKVIVKTEHYNSDNELTSDYVGIYVLDSPVFHTLRELSGNDSYLLTIRVYDHRYFEVVLNLTERKKVFLTNHQPDLLKFSKNIIEQLIIEAYEKVILVQQKR